MNFNRLAIALAASSIGASAAAMARDPGPVDATGRGSRGAERPRQTFMPERIDTSRLHGPVRGAAPRRRLYEAVERDVDRGAGRIEDRQTYEVRRLQDDRDERLGRIEPQRPAERFEEEYDRQRRLDAAAERARAARREARSPSNAPRPAEAGEPDFNPYGSPLARFVAEDERRLNDARERYQGALRNAELERDAALRAPGATREAKAAAARRFDQRRSQLTVQYQAYRRKILGMP